jgi:hypothetical protein
VATRILLPRLSEVAGARPEGARPSCGETPITIGASWPDERIGKSRIPGCPIGTLTIESSLSPLSTTSLAGVNFWLGWRYDRRLGASLGSPPRWCEFALPIPPIRWRSGIIFGNSMPKHAKPLPEWDRVLSAAAHLQRIFPDAVLVGGTASALAAGHRVSVDADHVLIDLRQRFAEVLKRLESVAGWTTARVQRPVQILGSLDGIETGIRQLIRTEPLETQHVNYRGQSLTVPTDAEMLRIKAVLILRRNATRDYLDFTALQDRLGEVATAEAMRSFDRIYPQSSGESPLQQLLIQLSQPQPYDLEETRLAEYKHLALRWQDWNTVRAACARCAVVLFDRLAGPEVL